jgi:formamidopyrimidine-DNA glycosylase
MPELPEVETIKQQLEKSIVGKKIKNAVVNYPRFIFGLNPKRREANKTSTVNIPIGQFKKTITNTKIKSVSRRAKLLIINLSNGFSLLIHLKMTGKLFYMPNPRGPSSGIRAKNNLIALKHARVIYEFAGNDKLIHLDMRKFGYIKLIKTDRD